LYGKRYGGLLLLMLLVPARASAEWQLKPFFGGVFAGQTTFIDLDHAAGNAHMVFGGDSLLLGDVIGVEADLGHTPSFFRSGERHLVLAGNVTSFTGNVVVSVPKRMAQYSLRPYLVGGGGFLHAHIQDSIAVLPLSRFLGAIDVGGGATGFLSEKVGLDWQLRYFRSVGGAAENGVSFGPEQLSYWRATMALAIRY
jgi:hypothetical protein